MAPNHSGRPTSTDRFRALSFADEKGANLTNVKEVSNTHYTVPKKNVCGCRGSSKSLAIALAVLLLCSFLPFLMYLMSTSDDEDGGDGKPVRRILLHLRPET